MRVECDRFERWASLYRDFRLPGRARTAVERHLGLCPGCAARYEAYSAVLDQAKPAMIPSSLIPADVTHEIPTPKPATRPRPWRRFAFALMLWVLGVIVLAALLAAAFVLGYRTGVRVNPPAPDRAIVEDGARFLMIR